MRSRRNSWGDGGLVIALMGGCLLAVSACSDQAIGSDTEELGTASDGVIIGTNDLVKVQAGGANLDARYRPIVNAIGRLSMGSGYCTATHLGNGVAISAGHCWEAGAARQNNASCTGSKVEWGYTSGGTASTSTCTKILAMQQSSGTNKLDYAIFQVSPVPPDFVPVDWSAKAPAATTITIFSHPQARPQEWSKTCAVQSPGSTQFTYQCDTEGGSSGATVLNDTNLKVTGVHWGGATSGNSATFILSTPIGEFLPQGDGGGTGGAGGADAGDGSAGKGGADGGDASPGDATSDAPKDGTTDATDGSGGAAGASGAGGTAGTGAGGAGAGGTAGTGGSAGKAGASGAGGSGTAGAGGQGGKAGSSGAGGSTGGGAGTGTGGAAGTGTGGAAGSGTGGAAGSGTGGSAGKGGTGGSTSTGTGGTGGTSSDDGGCSCRIESSTGGSNRAGGLFAALGLGLAATLRRSRRKTSKR